MKPPLRKYPLTRWFLFAFSLVAACSLGQHAQAAEKKLKLAFVTNNASDFWTIARAGTKKASEELKNVTVEFKIPEDGTAATQTRILDDLLSAGIDGIAISPVDPKNQTIKLDKWLSRLCSLPMTAMRPTAIGFAMWELTTSRPGGRQAN